jgi:hypothetical protein
VVAQRMDHKVVITAIEIVPEKYRKVINWRRRK